MSQPDKPGIPRRRWVLPVLVVTATLAVAGMITRVVLARWPDSPSPPPVCDVPLSSPLAGVRAPADEAPNGGGIRVVEKGFTQVGEPNGSLAGEGQSASLGAVLENTSNQVAYRTRITFRVNDASGESAASSSGGAFLVQEVPVILPKQRVAVGSMTYVRQDSSSRYLKVSRFELDLGEARWLSSEEGDRILAQVTARQVGVERSSVEAESGRVKFEAESGYCGGVHARGKAVVFRDPTGEIVGGGFEQQGPGQECPAGRFTGSANVFRSLPPGIDDSRTEVHLYCDVAQRDPGPAASGDPVN